MSSSVVFMVIGVAGVAFAIAMTAAMVRDIVRLRRDIRSGVVAESERAAAIERWVISSTKQLHFVAYAAVGGLTIALLVIPDGLRGLWLPLLLFAAMWLLRPLTVRQQRRYAKTFFS